jgi:hypothetical protein
MRCRKNCQKAIFSLWKLKKKTFLCFWVNLCCNALKKLTRLRFFSTKNYSKGLVLCNLFVSAQIFWCLTRFSILQRTSKRARRGKAPPLRFERTKWCLSLRFQGFSTIFPFLGLKSRVMNCFTTIPTWKPTKSSHQIKVLKTVKSLRWMYFPLFWWASSVITNWAFKSKPKWTKARMC